MLSQEKYCLPLLKRFETDFCNGHVLKTKETPMSPGTVLVKEGTHLPVGNAYCSIVGSLLYLAVNTRPNISFAVGALARHMAAPTEDHWNATKYLLRYLTKFTAYGLWYPNGKCRREIYIYADDAVFAGDKDSRKSTNGMLIQWGAHPIAWGSKLQYIVTT